MTTTPGAHYHVRRHIEDEDTLATYSLAEAMDYAATELDRMVDSEHTMIRVLGEQEDYKEAYCSWERVEAWANLQQNAANIHHQLTANASGRAPLYRPNDEESRARLQVAAEHTIGQINAYGPDGFVIWKCSASECAPATEEGKESDE